MKVAVISQLPPPLHGSTVMTRHLLDSISRLSHTAELVDRRFSRDVGEVGKIRARKFTSAISLFMRLWRALRSTPDCVVFFTTNRPASFVVDVTLCFLLRRARVPVIHYVHTSGYTALADKGWPWRHMTKYMLRTAAMAVTLSDQSCDDLIGAGALCPLVVIPNTVGEAPELPSTTRSRVLFYSNLIPEKGAEDFIDVALSLSPENPELEFTVAGAAPDGPYLQRLLAKSAESPRIKFLGKVEDVGQKWELLSSSRALIFPSTYPFEAQPLSILEAMAVGTPVLAYDTGAISDIIRDGQDGHVLPAGNKTRLREAVAQAIAFPARTERQGLSARARYLEHFGQDAFDEAWGQILERATSPQHLSNRKYKNA